MRIYFLSFFILISALSFAQKSGKASFYHKKFEGRKTSSGINYNSDSLTCAHRTLPFGTRLKVVNPENNNFVIVKVTDRGPFVKSRLIDLSYAAAERLGIIAQGVAHIEFTKLHELRLTPPIHFDKKGLFLATSEPHDAYDKLDIEKRNVLYTQR
ncbi:MAG: septal ring lytic transglycosylase RlpA family protein [Candidatus Saccharimonadaceae bacterium]